MLTWIVIFGVLGSIGAIMGAALILLLPEPWRRPLVPDLVSYAAGTLLGAALIGMMPASLARAAALPVMSIVLSGIVLFFLLEKFLLWRHCHDRRCAAHSSSASLILTGDALHNFIDGVVIAVAFFTSVPLGIATGLVVIAHELPQEIGDFAILLDGGYQPRAAFVANTLTSTTTLVGALAAYFWFEQIRALVPYILALSAASFIYIALADLIPGLHRQTTPATSLRQTALLLAGIGTVVLFHL